jgi:hypothetical protein
MKLTIWLARDKKGEKQTYLYVVKPQEKNGEYYYAGKIGMGVVGPLPKHYGLKPGECREIEVRL